MNGIKLVHLYNSAIHLLGDYKGLKDIVPEALSTAHGS